MFSGFSHSWAHLLHIFLQYTPESFCQPMISRILVKWKSFLGEQLGALFCPEMYSCLVHLTWRQAGTGIRKRKPVILRLICLCPCRLGQNILKPPRVCFKRCAHVFLCVFCSGYDFGYLIKILSNANLPEEEVDFFEILRLYFPVIYDVKYLMKSCKNLKVLKQTFQWVANSISYFINLKHHTFILCGPQVWPEGCRVTDGVVFFQGGLQEVAEQLELERIGPQHQAGSDSLLTGMAFFKMREVGSTNQWEEICRIAVHKDSPKYHCSPF